MNAKEPDYPASFYVDQLAYIAKAGEKSDALGYDELSAWTGLICHGREHESPKVRAAAEKAACSLMAHADDHGDLDHVLELFPGLDPVYVLH